MQVEDYMNETPFACWRCWTQTREDLARGAGANGTRRHPHYSDRFRHVIPRRVGLPRVYAEALVRIAGGCLLAKFMLDDRRLPAAAARRWLSAFPCGGGSLNALAAMESQRPQCWSYHRPRIGGLRLSTGRRIISRSFPAAKKRWRENKSVGYHCTVLT